jgi:hypothetical protein
VRVLFLDDDKQRFLEFTDLVMEMQKRGELGETDIKWAINAQMARSFLLECLQFDVAFLDHDLVVEHYAELWAPQPIERPREDDGKAVARTIVGMLRQDQPKRCHVHSWNYSGAKEMETILLEAEIPTTQAMFPTGIRDILAATWALQRKDG